MANNLHPVWKEDEVKCFKHLLSIHPKSKAIEEFLKCFPNRTYRGCEGYMKRHGLKGQKRREYTGKNKWTEEEKAYLIECYKGKMRKDAIKMFQEKYNRSDASCNFKANELGLMSDQNAKREWLKQTPFGSGELSKLNTERRYIPIGTIVVRKSSGRKFIKTTDEGENSRKNFITYARYVWEQNFGPIPKGCKLIHKDGDCTNDDISNLVLVKNARERRYIQDFQGQPDEIFNVGYNLARLKNAIKERERKEKYEK